MKRNYVIFAMVFFFSQTLHAQQTVAYADFSRSAVIQNKFSSGGSLFFKDTTYPKEYYLEKSKNQRTAAWVLLGGGVGLSIVGIIGVSANYSLWEENSAADTYVALTLVGTGLALGSIPLFIASNRNGREAAKLSFRNQPVLVPQQNSFVRKAQPTISLAIPL